jgi:hypothetical protein
MGMIFKKGNKELPKKTKIEKRVETLPTAELIGWSETTLYSVSGNLNNWQKSREKAFLEEAKIGVEVLSAIIKTLQERDL